MRRTRNAVVGLDHAELVLIAAEVLDADPDDVLSTADVAVLSGIATRLRSIDDVADAAAEVLVGIAAGRPFGGSDTAVAWLAAVVLIDRNEHTIGGEVDDWVRLVRRAADGSIGEREVAEALAPTLQPRAGRARRLLAAVCTPRPLPLPEVHPCPACGADVDRSTLWAFPVYAVPSRIELMAACARLRSTHDRTGAPRPKRPERPVARSYRVVLGRAEAGVAPFVAFTDRGPLAFRPVGGGTSYEVLAIDELTPSQLVGSWSSLWAEGRLVDRVPATACRLYDGAHLDWPRVVDRARRDEAGSGMSAYEEPPMESGAWAMIVSIFAVPLRPVPRYLESGRSYAGSNPLKWLVVALAALGYLLAIILYFVFALFPAISYVLLILLTLPLIVAVYAWKGIVRVARSSRESAGPQTSATRIRPATGGRQRPA